MHHDEEDLVAGEDRLRTGHKLEMFDDEGGGDGEGEARVGKEKEENKDGDGGEMDGQPGGMGKRGRSPEGGGIAGRESKRSKNVNAYEIS